MNGKKRIACFFTAGYTELNAMKEFMQKINNNVEYVQLCPIRARRSKAEIKNSHINQIRDNGLTGETLIDFIVEFVEKQRFHEEKYDAILIEDDKDDRFLNIQSDGTSVPDENAWTDFKARVQNRLREKYPAIPVIFFYAAPEVEAWFLADFDHSFGSVYSQTLSAQQNDFFAFQFRRYINDSLLTVRYRNCMEHYGYFDGIYRKLSEQIQNSLDTIDFLEDFNAEPAHKPIRYSKKVQGEDMLRKIEPEKIVEQCNYFFKEGFWNLRQI